ncbi:hypothetical protein [Legionella micdadei]|uniref:Cyanophycin synthetase n=1 Tax=Legionella micdadei TaxID=451 RepID=A0A098GDN1_LEGMI|nr:hypothetical protein [Legionella micdadei]ARG96345.1 hypothetical protein B6N58_00845 [Legionella micdadei]ARG99096.1 hypothetical protein B6V88_00840 [Legionella micdadei]KTD29572.1 UDP-N-acetylmuramyl tripeptide synthase [Legionella micdadei]NSL18031.1 UDP-N-acetylmuramyl peptide synthase [Legionella micdadei]CEG59546.1 putative UDP-N-acetylmuramyl tripeptide synthase [Legionella micdadei]
MVAKENLDLYYKNARDLHLPAVYSSDLEVVRIYLGKRNYYFMATITPFNDVGSSFLAKNKYLLNRTLEQARFPVPKAVGISKEQFIHCSLDELIHGLNFPLVVKPLRDTGRGKDVLCNIRDIKTLSEYLAKCFQYYGAMQVEEFHTDLKEYRVLLFRGKVIGVVERFPARVIGDGQHTIAELIDLTNEERAKKIQTQRHITHRPLVIDEEYESCLKEQQLTVDSIIPKGKTIRLCYTVNTGRGGDIFSHGKKIHPENAKYLRKVANQTGLNYVGLDVLCEDINQPFSKTKWLILEANFNPDITLHEVPSQGKAVNVTRKVLKHLIYRHPVSYLYHLYTKEKFSIYAKMILVIAGLILLMKLIKIV